MNKRRKMVKQCYRPLIVAAIFLVPIVAANAQGYLDFDADIRRYARTLNLPAIAVGVAIGDSLTFFSGIGTAVPGETAPITEDHIFTIASVTKTFTSVLLQQLEEEEKLSLDDRIDAFPNQYFNTNRWDSLTSLAQVISHTSESDPPGKVFAYNGSKFNLLYNAFAKLNPLQEGEPVTRPFTRQMEMRILNPLAMDHTLLRYDPEKHARLEPWVVVPYNYNDSLHTYLPAPIDLEKIESGPAYGMMSSIRDLIKYSNALSEGKLISAKRYSKITSPFYPGSPQGLGWFTKNFKGIEIHWAYGYGFNDSAIFLKIPEMDLTLIMLAPTVVPSASSRLGYGNPLNSPIVNSFLQNIVFKLKESCSVYGGEEALASCLINSKGKLSHEIYLEEALAWAALFILSPTSDSGYRERGILMLKWLSKHFSEATILHSATAMELMAASDDMYLMNFGIHACSRDLQYSNWHPSKLYFFGLLQDKLGHKKRAVELYKILAEGPAFKEQQSKFDALMKLALYFQKSFPEASKNYLIRLINYKEYIGAQDEQYRFAKSLYSQL